MTRHSVDGSGRWRSKLGWLLAGIATISVSLYVASFYLPDYYIGWATPEGPGVVDAMYFFPEMVSSIPKSWRSFWSGYFWEVVGTMIDWQPSNLWSVALDWGGWAGHVAFVACLLLIVAGWGRTALAVAATGIGCAVARHWTLEMNSGFLAGYYVWVGSLVAAGVAASVQMIRQRHCLQSDVQQFD